MSRHRREAPVLLGGVTEPREGGAGAEAGGSAGRSGAAAPNPRLVPPCCPVKLVVVCGAS